VKIITVRNPITRNTEVSASSVPLNFFSDGGNGTKIQQDNGREAWTAKKKCTTKISSAEMKFLRFVTGYKSVIAQSV
jgi:hypothetical protein